MSEPHVESITVDGRTLTIAVWGPAPPDIVLLHDGLGSIAQWRGVPAEVARRTGRSVMAYDRAGHGTSTPVPSGAWPADWLQTEAAVLSEVLASRAGERPLVVGHSDGGSIALLHAATPEADLSGVVALAPHSWVEQVCVDAIVSMRRSPAPIVAGLARFHREPAALFEAWSGVWTSAPFASWDIRPMLRTVVAPTLVVQGRADAFATPAHASRTAAAIGDNADHRLVDELGHLLHHDDAEFVIRTVVGFADWIGADHPD